MRFLVLSMLLATSSAIAGEVNTVRVLDVELKLETPAGYCVVGTESEAEKKLWQLLRHTSGKAEVVHLVAACSELKAYKNGSLDYLDNTAYILLPKHQGELKKIPYERAEFIEGFARAKSIPKIDVEAVSRTLRKAFEDKTARASAASIEMLGADQRAVYFAVRGSFEGGERKSWGVTSLGATTIAKSLLVNVYVSHPVGKQGSTPDGAVLQEYLNLLLRHN